MHKQDRRKTLFVLTAGVTILVAILAACTAATQQAEATPTSPSVAAPQEVQRITLEESKAAFDSDAAVFLDVRSETSYAASHIPGALSIPLAELGPRIAELDPNQWIITYCT
jgi:3-mercaptopyruvate sulfurtransferase SseA